LKPPCIANRWPMLTVEKSPETKKPMWSPCVVAKLLRDMRGGHYACSLIRWWSCILSTLCPMH